jgi:hypothetical protein
MFVTQVLPEVMEGSSILWEEVAGGEVTTTTKPRLISHLGTAEGSKGEGGFS